LNQAKKIEERITQSQLFTFHRQQQVSQTVLNSRSLTKQLQKKSA